MQLPVGWALDTLGPRRTASVLFLGGRGGGRDALRHGTEPGTITLAMILIGIGCAPILMSTYYIFARTLPAAIFGTLAGLTVGVLARQHPVGGTPGLGGGQLRLARDGVGLRRLHRADRHRHRRPGPRPAQARGRAARIAVDLLAMPALWPILIAMFVCYAPAAGVRGLWISPYVAEVHGAALSQIGIATLAMGLAMVAGNFVYGPIDRWLGTRKGPILVGNLTVAPCS
jgi:hypothetical protein